MTRKSRLKLSRPGRNNKSQKTPLDFRLQLSKRKKMKMSQITAKVKSPKRIRRKKRLKRKNYKGQFHPT